MLDKEVSQETPAATTPVSGDVPQEPKITDLDGLSEFTFQGEKFNPDRLHQTFREHKEWSEKIKAYEKNQEFEKNLEIDLDNVLNDPKLADRFKAIYPKMYHAILDKLLSSRSPAQAQSTQPAQNTQPPKEFLDRLGHFDERLKFFEQRAYQAEVEAASAKLDSVLPPLFKAHPLANEDQVYARAEALLQQGQKLSEKTWERIVRESHDYQKKKSDQVYSAELKSQLEKGQKGRDIGPGGSTPGQAPVRPKTFDEAREAMIKSMNRQ